MIGSCIPGSLFVTAHTDYDDSGLFRNYNTDNTRESSIRYDDIQDTIRKSFFISASEFNAGEIVNLWIYAKCFGDKNIYSSPTHKIKIQTETGTSTGRYFSCYKTFSYNEFQWQMFQFSMACLDSDRWVMVEIEDIDYWGYNNLEIGIDKTFGFSPADPTEGKIIQDWDQSYWYSWGAGVTPAEENEIQGELMIKLEVARIQKEKRVAPLQFDYPSAGYDPYTFIPLDDYQDKVKWKCFDITPADIDSLYARLYIWGYSWLSGEDPPQTTNKFSIEINGNNLWYDPDEYWARTQPIGHWYYYDFNPQDYLIQGTNVFEIGDLSSDYKRHNLGVIYFSDVDNDQSAWVWNAGPHGSGGDSQLRYDHCTGELGIYLFIYKDYESHKRVGGINLWCEDHDSDECAWFEGDHGEISQPAGKRIAERLDNNHDWWDYMNLLDDYTEGDIWEGDFYAEGWHDTHLGGDTVDLLIFDGHGARSGGAFLENHDFDERESTTHNGEWDKFDIFWSKRGYTDEIQGKPETDNWDYQSNSYVGFSEDGLNLHADWILLLACSLLHGFNHDIESSLTLDSPWLTMMYHGVHIMMGFGTVFGGTAAEMRDFSDTIVDEWCVHYEYTIMSGFIRAVLSELQDEDGGDPWNRYVMYYQESNANDYLYDEGTVSNDYDFENGYENRNIRGMADARGLDV